jgi:hypothetical protein
MMGSRRIAVHEAGHIVVARLLDLSCGATTIERDPSTGALSRSTIHRPLKSAHLLCD